MSRVLAPSTPAMSFASAFFLSLVLATSVSAQVTSGSVTSGSATTDAATTDAASEAVTDRATPPAARSGPPRVLVLRVGGDSALAAALGRGLRDAVHAHTRTLELTPLPTDGGCDDLECAEGFLATDAADVAAYVEVFGRDDVCRGVQATLLAGEARFVGTAEVGTAGVEEAMRVALAQAVARFRGQSLPTLGVQGTPAGASIRLDGVTWGSVPHAEPVAPGRHTLEVRARGHRVDRREIELAGEDMSVEITLVPGEDEESVSGGGDALPLWIAGATTLAAGLAGIVVGIVGFAMGESCVEASCERYERPDAVASGVWLGAGGALTMAGSVMLGVAASAGNGSERAALNLRATF